MDKIEFKKLLFKVAFCTMACDGQIHKNEVEEMKLMDNRTSFFDNIDLSNELSQLVTELETKGKKVISELFSTIKSCELNTIQELLLLEVVLRIINADKKYDENELKFLHLIRAKLNVHDETIKDRFGKVDVLYTNDYSQNIVLDKSDNEFLRNIKLPSLNDFEDIKSSIKK